MNKHLRPAPFVTAHAIVRWLERVHGIDVSLLMVQTCSASDQELLEQIEYHVPGFSAVVSAHLRDVCRRAFALGGPHYLTDDALFVFRGGALITVLERDMKPPVDGEVSRARSLQ